MNFFNLRRKMKGEGKMDDERMIDVKMLDVILTRIEAMSILLQALEDRVRVLEYYQKKIRSDLSLIKAKEKESIRVN